MGKPISIVVWCQPETLIDQSINMWPTLQLSEPPHSTISRVSSVYIFSPALKGYFLTLLRLNQFFFTPTYDFFEGPHLDL